MSTEPADGLYRALADGGATTPEERLHLLVALCQDVLTLSGAGIMLMAERVHQGTIAATDDRIRRLEDLQNDAGEGPCLDAYNLGRPVLEPDLATRGRLLWPLLASGAIDAGIAALFSFPLQLDDSSFGALNLYRDRPGPLSPVQIADARLLAAMAAREVLSMQAEAVPGSLPSSISDLSGDRAAIEQATGMVAAQTGGTIGEAAALLRAHAVHHRVPLVDVAHQVVARALRFA